ncbi:MAG TPA: ATP-binding protein, partial [Ilumatobacteraceae bacterium]|nr:ATP-binding protein [Ilumatobacteraceae bacterium]
MTGPVDLLMRSYPSAPRSARAARDFVVGELRRATATERAVADFELIVSELVANSVQYGNGTEIVVGVDAVT